MLDKNGQSATAEQIARDHPCTETRLVFNFWSTGSELARLAKDESSRSSFSPQAIPKAGMSQSLSWKRKTDGKQLGMQTHILGGKDSYNGVGPYRKYCWTVGQDSTYYSDFGGGLDIVNDADLSTIFEKGYSIRLLKLVYHDTPADEPYSKNPYR